MRIPVWVTIAAAVFVIGFGLFRIRIALTRKAADDADAKARGGLYGVGSRAHLFIGILYLALGGVLVAMSLGWTPFGNQVGPSTEKPAKGNAPTKTGVPMNQLPAPKK